MINNKKNRDEEKKGEKLLSEKEQKKLAKMAQSGDREAQSKLIKYFIKTLNGYISGKIAGSKVLDIGQAQTLANKAIDRAIRCFNPQRKEQFYNFIKRNADIVIENKLGIMAQDGNKHALLEVFLWLDKPLVSFIKKKCPYLDYGAAEGLAWQTWERFLSLKDFDPDGRQSFFDYLKNKAKTVISHNNQLILESSMACNNE